MAKAKQLNIAAISQIAANSKGDACLVRVETNEGKEFDLVFAVEAAPTIANRMMVAQAMALGRAAEPPLTSDRFVDEVSATLVSACTVQPSEDASFIQVEMVSGEARTWIGLPPDVSAALRGDLEIAERSMATTRKASRN